MRSIGSTAFLAKTINARRFKKLFGDDKIQSLRSRTAEPLLFKIYFNSNANVSFSESHAFFESISDREHGSRRKSELFRRLQLLLKRPGSIAADFHRAPQTPIIRNRIYRRRRRRRCRDREKGDRKTSSNIPISLVRRHKTGATSARGSSIRAGNCSIEAPRRRSPRSIDTFRPIGRVLLLVSSSSSGSDWNQMS